MVRSLSSPAFRLMLLAATLIAIVAPKLTAQTPTTGDIEKAIQPLVADFKGDVAIAIHHLESGTRFNLRGDVPMPTASLIKLPVMIEAYRQSAAGKVDLNQKITLQETDKVPGSGILTTHFSAGATISLRDAIRLMMVYSDNTATNLVAEAIGLAATANSMKELGYPETQLHSKVFRRDTSIAPERSEKYGLGSTTADDMVNLLTQLKRGELADASNTEAMLDHLLNCDDKSRFPLLLPKDVKVAHKTGSVNRIRTDAGLIMTPGCTIALCVLTDNLEDSRWTDENAGNRLCAEVAKTSYELFSPKTAAAVAPKGNLLQIGASGDVVESLQRTLNARSTPSPKLSVDGDFGPGTETAVREFQKQKNIDPSGIVDQSTWDALGDLIDSDPPVPSPVEVNSEVLSRAVRDDPLGPPQVSCTAWTIVDRKLGNAVASHKADERLNIASTTKIMTAYIVLELAAADPKVLDEVITFSSRADATNGSTASVRAGEQLTVSELLYGLLLPSGNDASVALAEHFGARFGDPAASQPDAAYESFIAQMNVSAKELGMMNTEFKNPHGLTAAGHLSTASDLARLAAAALEVPRFRDYVGTRQHGTVVIGASGYKRNIKWENTNRLLQIEGYLGVKTGTTDAAGACLVSCSERDGDELIVVVLGAANSDARYIDSRNLHAYGWRTKK